MSVQTLLLQSDDSLSLPGAESKGIVIGTLPEILVMPLVLHMISFTIIKKSADVRNTDKSI